MINTVRARLLAAIKAGILAAGSGRVGAVRTFGDSLDNLKTLLDDGKYVVEMYVTDDEPAEPKPTVEEAVFGVGLLVHIPPSAVAAAVNAGSTASSVAADINADLYLVYAASDEAGQFGGLAVMTSWAGSDDVAISDEGTFVTAHRFNVTYRFVRGNPAVVP